MSPLAGGGYAAAVELEIESLTLTELIQLQTRLLEAMNRRFQRPLALMFSDVVGSTPYFRSFGDVAGRGLMQRHLDQVRAQLGAHQGRLVDAAGDGAFLCFPGQEPAARAAIALLRAVDEQNDTFPPEHRLSLRVGLHFGAVLTDGELVSGDAVNVCSRVAAAARPGEIWLSIEAHQELPGLMRAQCLRLGGAQLKGVGAPLELFSLAWRDRRPVPCLARVVESGQVFPLPAKDVIRFGRAGDSGVPEEQANDIVLKLEDPDATAGISRWHFELRRRPSGLVLRSVTDRPTLVGGTPVARGEEVRVSAGAVVRVSGVLTVELSGDERLAQLGGAALAETRQT